MNNNIQPNKINESIKTIMKSVIIQYVLELISVIFCMIFVTNIESRILSKLINLTIGLLFFIMLPIYTYRKNKDIIKEATFDKKIVYLMLIFQVMVILIAFI